MKGYDILTRALVLLGYTDSHGDIIASESVLRRGCGIIGQIAADLGSSASPASLEEEIQLNTAQLEAMPYGVAMLLSLAEGDGGKNELFCELYNAKRAAARSINGHISETLFQSCGGIT